MGVSILPAERSPWQILDKAIGRNLENNLPQAVERGYNRGMLQNNLGQIKDIANNPQGTNLDVLVSLLQAGAGIPGSEKYISAIAPELIRAVESNRASRTPLPGEAGQSQPHQVPRNREPMEQVPERRQLPELGGNRFHPTNLGSQGGMGHIPQQATTGQKLPLIPPNEKPSAIKKLIADSKKEGITLTIPEAKAQIDANEEDKRAHNTQVDAELKQQVEGQKTYGDRAVEYLNNVYPKANPEVKAIFQKIGEQAASRGESEADINRYLSKEADKFKNAIANVQKDMSAPRLLNSISRGLKQEYKNFDQSAADARRNIQPLIDLGLFDTARNLLADKDYGPEERDIIVNPLSSRSQSIINKILPVTKAGPLMPSGRNVDPNEIKSTLQELKQIEPNFSLLLARKAMEDKGIGWRDFKDALNELEQEGFQLEDDQRNQRGYLDTPPLNILGKMLHGINLIGR